MKRLLAITASICCVIPGIALGDDISDARHLLCSVLHSDVCLNDDGCATVEPFSLNLPQFIRVDARSGKLSTTPTSGQNRETTAGTVSRSDGQLILQGIEQGRAYSLFIDEASGDATFASAADGVSLSVFAACTPAPGN
jgi:hypothetical protein